MKFETLVTRYKNLGYTPRGLERDLEIASIIKWIYETYDYYVYCNFMTLKFPHYKQFTGAHISQTKQDHFNQFYCKEHFDNPYDALYDSVRDLYRHLRFMGDSIKIKK
jgi:hypothetical protein